MKPVAIVLFAAIAAAFFRASLALPTSIAMIAVVLSVSWLVAELGHYQLQEWRRRRRPPSSPDTFDDYVECGDQEVVARNYERPLYTRCQLRKGHDGDHEGSLSSATWPRSST